MGFKIPGVSKNFVKDLFSVKGAGAIAIGQPGYLYDKSKERKKDAANAEVAAQKSAAIQAANDSQDSANMSIIEAKRRRRASSLYSSAGLGGPGTALGQGGGFAPAAASVSALGAGGGY